MSAQGRHRNDRVCAERITVGSPAIGDGFYEYRPSYRVQYSGRLSEDRGGLQSCSRAMKQAALQNRSKRVRNYDLRASQAIGLLQELEDAALDREWLAAYLGAEDGATRRGAALGLSKDAYKACAIRHDHGSTVQRQLPRRKRHLRHTR